MWARIAAHGWTIINSILRLFQIIGAIVVIVYYGSILDQATKQHKYADGKFVYATVVSSASLATSLVLLFMPWVNQTKANSVLFVWETLLFLMWMALAITFRAFFTEKAEMDSAIQKMIVAVGFDTACMGLWSLTAARSTYIFVLNIGKSGVFFVGRLKPSEDEKKNGGALRHHQAQMKMPGQSRAAGGYGGGARGGNPYS